MFRYLKGRLSYDRELCFYAGISGRDNQQELLRRFALYNQDPYIKALDEKILKKIEIQIQRYQNSDVFKANIFRSLLSDCYQDIVDCYLKNYDKNEDNAGMTQINEALRKDLKQQMIKTLNRHFLLLGKR